MNSKKNFALFSYLGIEINNYIFTKLTKNLKESANVNILTNINNYKLDKLLEENNLNKIYINRLKKVKISFIENYFLSSRRSRLKICGEEIFDLWKDVKKIDKKDFFKGNSIIYYSLFLLWHFVIKKNYFDKELAKILKSNDITDLIIQGYSSIENKTVAITAQKIGCKVWVINWSWKDFYINEFIPINIDGFFTWSKKLKQKYAKYNKHISKEKIYDIGNLSFQKLKNYKQKNALKFYAEKYNFDLSKKIIIYTMAHPNFYKSEEKIIQKIVKAIEKSFYGKFILLIKPNPMNDDCSSLKSIITKNNIILLENLWEYNKKDDVNFISEAAINEWYDLLSYSFCSMSIPSTVTIESLIFRKPVLNILFDEENQKNNHFTRLYNSSFYKDCTNRSDVFGCYKTDDINSSIEKIIKKIEIESIDEIININEDSMSILLNKVLS